MNLLEALSAKIVIILGEKHLARNATEGVHRALMGTHWVTVSKMSTVAHRNTDNELQQSSFPKAGDPEDS